MFKGVMQLARIEQRRGRSLARRSILIVAGVLLAIGVVSTVGAGRSWASKLLPRAAPVTTFTISGAVTNAGNNPISDVNVTLSGGASATVPTGPDGKYSFPNLPANGNYAVTPSKSGFTFTPPSFNEPNLIHDDTANFTGNPQPTASISGTVFDNHNAALKDIIIKLSGSALSQQITGPDGKYFFGFLTGSHDYTVTASAPANNYTFAPLNYTFQNLNVDQPNQNFIATPVQTFGISGTVIDSNSQPMNNVSVSLTGATTLGVATGPDGKYSFPGLAPGFYTVTPSKSGYNFSPPNYSNLNTDKTDANFVGTPVVTLTISGNVTDLNTNSPTAGVTMTLSGGANLTTSTNGAGHYSFPGLAPSFSYTVTPSKTGLVFTPLSTNFGGVSTDQTANFKSLPTPTLGNYAGASLALSGNATVMPSAAPMGANYATATTTANFKGKLEADPATGVVRVTNAHPAGTYTVTVRAYNSLGVPTSKTFTLTVTTPAPCDVFGPTAFSAAAAGTGSTPISVAVGDFNGDGKQDIVTASDAGKTVSVLLRNAANTGFDPKADFAVGGVETINTLAVGDFNGDGKQDIVTASLGSTNVSVLLRNAANTGFDPKVDVATGSGPISIAVGDFNGDGKQDIVAGTTGGTASVLLRNAANTGFDSEGDVPLGTNPYSVTVGDFNGDGKQDFVAGNKLGGSVGLLLRNAANTGFDPTIPIAVGNGPRSVAAGDFNGDGKQDLVTVNRDAFTVSVLLRNAANTGFDPKVDFGIGGPSLSVAVGDFNGDGQQDIVTESVAVLLRNAANTGFDPMVRFATGSGAIAVAVGDFNGDGKQDVVTANNSGNSVSVLQRKCNTAPTITAAAPLSRRRGGPVSNSQIATVGDVDQAADTLHVTATPLTGTGVAILNISIDGSGNVSAAVDASCTATNSTFNLTVTDNATATTTAPLTVNVTLNTAPTLLYGNQSVAFGGSLDFSPTVASDNGAVVAFAVQAGHGLTTAPTIDALGTVSITNAQPVGTHTITIRATDNCGATTDAAFTLEVTPPPPQLMIDTSGPDPNQAAALDSELFLRDPFPVVSTAIFLNQGADRNTRVMIFVANLQLLPGELPSTVVVNLVDSQNSNYDVAAEDVRLVPNLDFVQVIFRLPNGLPVGPCTVKVKAHGQVSNPGVIRIRI